MNTSHVSPEHLSSGQVAAMLDERLHGPDRGPALAHLAACAECRREMAELHRALHDRSRERRSVRPWLVASAGIAAALVLVTIPAELHRARASIDRPAPTVQVQRAPDDAAAPIVILSPRDGAAVIATASLIWRPAGPSASYLVTVQDTSGAVIWSSALTDTTIAVPASARLASGQTYFWSVDARLSNGVSSTTGVRTFTVR